MRLRKAELVFWIIIFIWAFIWFLFSFLAKPVKSGEWKSAGEVALKILPMQDKDQIWMQPYTAGANGFKLISGSWPPVRPCEGVWKWGYEINDGHRLLIAKCGDTVVQMNNFIF